jgi:hypothetical protein
MAPKRNTDATHADIIIKTVSEDAVGRSDNWKSLYLSDHNGKINGKTNQRTPG